MALALALVLVLVLVLVLELELELELELDLDLDLDPNGVAPSSPGLAEGLPWGKVQMIPNSNGVVPTNQ